MMLGVKGGAMSGIRRGLRIAYLVASLSLTACFAIPNSGPTAVSRAELYESSEPEYDAFFYQLHSVQTAVSESNNEQRKMRSALAAELGLEVHTSMDLIATHFDKRLASLAEGKSTLRIEFIGLEEGAEENDAVVTLTDASGNAVSNSLTQTLEPLAKGLVKMLIRLRRSKVSIGQLQSRLSALETNLEERFRLLGPARSKETRRNLTDARAALPALGRSIDSAEEDAREVLKLLQKASPAPEESPETTTGKPGVAPKPSAPKASPKQKPTSPKTGGFEP